MGGRVWLNNILMWLKIGRKWRRKIVRIVCGSFTKSAAKRIKEINKELDELYLEFVSCNDRKVIDIHERIKRLEVEIEHLNKELK